MAGPRAKRPSTRDSSGSKGSQAREKPTLMKCALRHAQDSFEGAEETSASFFFNARGDRGILNREHDAGYNHSLVSMLEHIPDRLEDLFDNVQERSETNSHFLLAMQWVIFATMPLKPEQLYYAIMSGTGQLDPNTVVRNSRVIDHTSMTAFILASSRGLLEETLSASAAKRRVQFIHEGFAYCCQAEACGRCPDVAERWRSYRQRI